MGEERISPLRQRMIEDMRIRGMGEKAQAARKSASGSASLSRKGCAHRTGIWGGNSSTSAKSETSPFFHIRTGAQFFPSPQLS